MKIVWSLLILNTVACHKDDKTQNLPKEVPTQVVQALKSEDAPSNKAPVGFAEGKEFEKIQEKEKEKQPEQNAARISGEISSINKAIVGFQTSGHIQAIFVRPGTIVKKGELLAKLDARDAELRFSLSKLKREQAKLALQSAEKDFQREKQLRAEEVSSEIALEKITTALDSARINFKLTEVDYALSEKNLGDATLTAPFDCLITKQLKSSGEQVNPQTQSGAIFEVYDMSSPLEVNLEVPEKFLGAVAIHDLLDVQIPALQYSTKIKIIRLVPVVSSTSRNFQVVGEFQDKDPRLVPGHFVEGKIALRNNLLQKSL